MNAHSIPLLFASFLLAACGSTVVIGGGTSGSTGGPGDSSAGGGTAAPPGAPPIPAVALSRAQMDVLWDTYWQSHDQSGSAVSTGSGPALDPNDLFLRLSDIGVSCGSPTVELPCGLHYSMSLVLPPAFQKVGVYDLEDPQFIAYSSMSESGALNSADPKDCGWGGGSIGKGTLEILSIDPTEVHFTVTMPSGIWESDPSGDYTAPRCP